MNPLPDELDPQTEPPRNAGIRMLQTGLLIAGSALMGGLAVVLWHRKSLAKLRQPSPVPESASADQNADEA